MLHTIAETVGEGWTKGEKGGSLVALRELLRFKERTHAVIQQQCLLQDGF